MFRKNRERNTAKGGGEEASKRSIKRRWNAVCGWVSGMLMIFLLIVAIYAVLSSYRERQYGTPFFLFGWKPVVVLSESMEPTYTSGDIIIVRERTGTPRLNDIVLFRERHFGMNTYVTHRLIGKDEGGYITKGDNNAYADPGRVQEQDILGTVEFVLF